MTYDPPTEDPQNDDGQPCPICGEPHECNEDEHDGFEADRKGDRPMDLYFSVFNGHINRANDRARALMAEHFPHHLEEVERIEAEGNGIMAIFDDEPSPATATYVSLVTAFVNLDPIEEARQQANGWPTLDAQPPQQNEETADDDEDPEPPF